MHQSLNFYTVEEVADILRIHKESARSLIAKGEIEGMSIGKGQRRRKWRVSQAALEDFIRRRTEQSQPGPKPQRSPAVKPKRQWV
ncbi:Helix-turn-helix domain protein [Crateriforma conspicua]|uniref:Helix-turn-helix domain protein n=1 Tax=Crateriforma conspicua TaxID=2527996 RepID=A0A5C6FVA2_9PLAN|nr:helix-turn-helix domain-containing protein [Crateriforma conspicua]TWU66899.1 Helix-turn-helix domain protein [Crateriforma conspicua]